MNLFIALILILTFLFNQLKFHYFNFINLLFIKIIKNFKINNFICLFHILYSHSNVNFFSLLNLFTIIQIQMLIFKFIIIVKIFFSLIEEFIFIDLLLIYSKELSLNISIIFMNLFILIKNLNLILIIVKIKFFNLVHLLLVKNIIGFKRFIIIISFTRILISLLKGRYFLIIIIFIILIRKFFILYYLNFLIIIVIIIIIHSLICLNFLIIIIIIIIIQILINL